jgi:hypothetical protein
VVIAQAVAAVWIIHLLLRTQRFDVRPATLPGITALLAIATALPWLASELLTDIFAGLAVVGFHLLAWQSDRISPRERFALVVFVAFAVSTHSATYAVLLALGIVVIFLFAIGAKFVPRARLFAVAAAMFLGAAMLLGGNFAVGRTLAWTPGGYGLAFARMLQDGIVTRYLDDHCPDPRLKLCPYRKELPLDADAFLWGESVFNKLGRFTGLGDEMRTIVLGSLRDYPAIQIEKASIATAKQLVSIGTGEGVLTTIWHTYGIIERYTPSVVPAMRAARQQHGEIHFAAVNAVHVPVGWASMALLPALAIYGLLDSDFADLSGLATTIALALLANAAFCGVISHPEPRYGSRLVWIASFTVGLSVWRAVTLARERAPPLMPGSASTA